VLRATRKLLGRLGPVVSDPPPSSTVLGDWYAKPFGIGPKRFVLLVSEKSRLAVLMPGRDVANLPRNFPQAMAVQLARIGVPQALIDHELRACADTVVATTASKSLLGTLNDFALLTKARDRHRDDFDLADEALSLSHTPVSVLGFEFPADVARRLFGLDLVAPSVPF
jgi:hypothetical protein